MQSKTSNKSAGKDTKDKKGKLIIYQVFPRIFTNTVENCVPDGPLHVNGSGKMSDYTPELLTAIKRMGVNTLWFTGILECATKTAYPEAGIKADNPNVVKGEAGSPYAIKDYYDISPCLADNPLKRMSEFEALVKRVHDCGMKLLVDFVPNHTAREYHSDAAPEGVEDFGTNDRTDWYFERDNNYYYIPNQQFSPGFDISGNGNPYIEFPAKATGNDCFTAFCGVNDWYETAKLNYGHDYGDGSDHFYPEPDTWLKMRDILKFWVSKGVDGFRCDMVFMVPQAFWHWVIPQIKNINPDIVFIGEIYDVGLYRPFLDYCGFDYLYDKVNLYDTLVGIENKGFSAARLTGCWQTVDGIGDRMLNFLENHDEVRYASEEYAGDPSKVVPSLVVSSMIGRGPFMIYYGQELGENGETNEGFAGNNHRSTIFDYWSYPTMRRWYNNGRCDGGQSTEQEKWLRSTYSKILNMCNTLPAISTGEFFDLMYVNLNNPGINPHRQFAFIRHCEEEALLIVANFDTEAREISVNIPEEAIRYASLETGCITAEDLLAGKESELEISSESPAKFAVGGNYAAIFRIRGKVRKQSLKKDNNG